MANNNSFVTVLSTENYLKGVLALAKSIQNTHTNYPITVLINNNISIRSQEILKSHNLNVIKKDSFQIPNNIKIKNEKGPFSHWNNTFDKLLLFSLTDFDKLVYLDSDMYVRKNIDNLFSVKSMSATLDRPIGPIINDTIEKKLTSGIMVIEPDPSKIASFINIIQSISDKRDCVGDQDILQEYDPNWKSNVSLHLDYKYNMFFPHLDYFTHYYNYKLEDVSVIHFIYTKKPFMFEPNNIQNYIDYIEKNKIALYKSHIDLFPYDYISIGNTDEKIVLDEYIKLLSDISLD